MKIGTYKLEYQAFGDDGTESEKASLTIKIEPDPHKKTTKKYEIPEVKNQRIDYPEIRAP